MATTPRHGKPYVWCTWLTGILSGEDSCQYAPWFKASFKFDKVDRGFDLAAWKSSHAKMVSARFAELEADGWTVFIEDQNSFKIEGENAILAGKPDIVANRGTEVLVVDCKGGKPRDSDYQQVLLYLYALPKTRSIFANGFTWRGEVCYYDNRRVVHIEELSQHKPAIFQLMRVVGSQTPPAKVPSLRECRFCDISKTDCPERIEQSDDPPVLVSEF